MTTVAIDSNSGRINFWNHDRTEFAQYVPIRTDELVGFTLLRRVVCDDARRQDRYGIWTDFTDLVPDYPEIRPVVALVEAGLWQCEEEKTFLRIEKGTSKHWPFEIETARRGRRVGDVVTNIYQVRSASDQVLNKFLDRIPGSRGSFIDTDVLKYVGPDPQTPTTENLRCLLQLGWPVAIETDTLRRHDLAHGRMWVCCAGEYAVEIGETLNTYSITPDGIVAEEDRPRVEKFLDILDGDTNGMSNYFEAGGAEFREAIEEFARDLRAFGSPASDVRLKMIVDDVVGRRAKMLEALPVFEAEHPFASRAARAFGPYNGL